MEDIRMRDERVADRVAEAVRHALRLVGPAERGSEPRDTAGTERSA
jgi:hypothetical protein